MIKSKRAQWKDVGNQTWNHYTNNVYDGWVSAYRQSSLLEFRWGACVNGVWTGGAAPTSFLAKHKVLSLLQND